MRRVVIAVAEVRGYGRHHRPAWWPRPRVLALAGSAGTQGVHRPESQPGRGVAASFLIPRIGVAR